MNPVSAIVTMIFLIIAAVSLGTMEVGFRPELRRFPCFDPVTRGIMVIHAVIAFARAATLFDGLSRGEPEAIAPSGVILACSMGIVYAAFLVKLVLMRQPAGVYERLMRRKDVAKKAMAAHPDHREAVANLIAQGGMAIITTPSKDSSAFLEVK